jgi:hypothetical protein
LPDRGKPEAETGGQQQAYRSMAKARAHDASIIPETAYSAWP